MTLAFFLYASPLCTYILTCNANTMNSLIRILVRSIRSNAIRKTQFMQRTLSN